VSAAAGLHQAVFPEGELSRDGTMNEPKLGFLNYICRACSEQRDIVFIPVGINYDRIPEDRRLTSAEGSFENPSARFLIGSSLRYIATVLALPFRSRNRRFGHACVSFGQPLSLRAWLRDNDVNIDDLRGTGRYPWLPALGDELMQRCGHSIPVPPVPLAALALTTVDAPQSAEQLESTMKDLAARLEANGAGVFLPHGLQDACNFVIEMLVHNRLVEHDSNGQLAIVEAGAPVLKHYANSISHMLP
jgi:glycerol-3-phosphate O-acyltransferase